MLVHVCKVMKRRFKQWRLTIPSILTKRTTTSHLDSLNTKKTMKYDIGNPGPGLGQAQTCGGGLMLMQSQPRCIESHKR